MIQLDFKKDFKAIYNPSPKAPTIVEVPTMQFLMIDGKGDPNNSAEYTAAVESLYSLSFPMKIALKKQDVVDYSVGPLEGQWWVADGTPVSYTDRTNWRWTMMIMQPPQVTAEYFEQTRQAALKKKPELPLAQVRLESLTEGLVAQIIHFGPYSAEPPTVDKLHSFIEMQGYHPRAHSHHHEVYLSDPRRVEPDKLKTILRQPIEKI